MIAGATILGSATANGTGAWTYATGAVASGAHTLTATATDKAGNTGVASSTFAVTVDTTAPVADHRRVLARQRSVGDGVTNDNTVTLAGTTEANGDRQGEGRRNAFGHRHGQRRRRLDLYHCHARRWRPQPHSHCH